MKITKEKLPKGSTYPVSSRDSEEAKEYLAKTVVPEFVDWAHKLANLPANSSKFTGQQFMQWNCPKNKFITTDTIAIKHLVPDKEE